MNNQEIEKKNPITLKMNKNTFQTYYCLPYNGKQPELTMSLIKILTEIESISIEYKDNNKLVITFPETCNPLSLKKDRVLLCNTKNHELQAIHQNDYFHEYINPIHYWEVTDTDNYTYEYPPEEYLKALKKLSEHEAYKLTAEHYTDEELEHILDPPMEE